jgi:hypothetical protein
MRSQLYMRPRWRLAMLGQAAPLGALLQGLGSTSHIPQRADHHHPKRPTEQTCSPRRPTFRLTIPAVHLPSIHRVISLSAGWWRATVIRQLLPSICIEPSPTNTIAARTDKKYNVHLSTPLQIGSSGFRVFIARGSASMVPPTPLTAPQKAARCDGHRYRVERVPREGLGSFRSPIEPSRRQARVARHDYIRR